MGKGCNSPVIWAGSGVTGQGTFERELQYVRKDMGRFQAGNLQVQRLQARRWLSDSKIAEWPV